MVPFEGTRGFYHRVPFTGTVGFYNMVPFKGTTGLYHGVPFNGTIGKEELNIKDIASQLETSRSVSRLSHIVTQSGIICVSSEP